MFWKTLVLHLHTNRNWMHGNGRSCDPCDPSNCGTWTGEKKLLLLDNPIHPSVHVPSSCTCVCLPLMFFGIIFHGHFWNKWSNLEVIDILFLLFRSTCITHAISIIRFDFRTTCGVTGWKQRKSTATMTRKFNFSQIDYYLATSKNVNLKTTSLPSMHFSLRQVLPFSHHAFLETWRLKPFTTTFISLLWTSCSCEFINKYWC